MSTRKPEPALQLSHPAVDVTNLRVVSQEVLDASYEAAKANNLKLTAAALDDMFGDQGRSVSESLLRATLKNSNHNYARLEWAPLLVSLPGSRVLELLAAAAGYALVKREPVNDALFRDRARRLLPRLLGEKGAEVLEALER